MPRLTFSLLAAFVTVGGLALVVVLARALARRAGRKRTWIALALLALYALACVARADVALASNVAVLTGAVGGVLLLERGLGTASSVAVFMTVAAIVDVVSVSGGVSRARAALHSSSRFRSAVEAIGHLTPPRGSVTRRESAGVPERVMQPLWATRGTSAI